MLRNTSGDRDAGRVRVTVNAVDASNAVIKTDSTTIEVIPAGTTYYHGGWMFPDPATNPVRLETFVQVGESRPKSASMPPVSNVALGATFFGDAEVRGEVSNPSTRPLSGLARITVVVFDTGGNVLGGSFTYPSSAVPPGGRIGFSASVDGVSLPQVASAQVSVEPDFD